MHPANHPPLLLPAELTVSQTAGLRSRLVEALAGGQPVALDASCVRAVDTIGLQVLVSALRSAGGAGLDWRVTAPSQALLHHARGSGLEQALSL